MWDAIAAFIKSFNEKYLIPLVISVVVAIVVIVLLPSDYWMIIKIGGLAFGIAIAGIAFLVVILFRYVFSLIKKGMKEASVRRYRDEQNQIQNEINIKEFWERIDRYSPEEREIIRKIVETGNKPVSEFAYVFHHGDSIFESGLMVSTIMLDEQERYIRVYKLKDEYFKILNYSIEKYNKISNFD